MPTNKVDHKWYDALKSISLKVEGHSNVALYFEDDDRASVDAERTLRHFLEVTCNLRVPVDTSEHKVPLADGNTFPASAPRSFDLEEQEELE